MQRRQRTIDSGIPGVSPADQELIYEARREQEAAMDRGNFEWASVMRDKQRVLLGDEHRAAPDLGPGLDLQALTIGLRDIEERVAALRAEVERVAAMSAKAAEDAEDAREGLSLPE